MKHITLAAFSCERRVAALATFREVQLEHLQLRHLPIDPLKAIGSVRELVVRSLEHNPPEFLAISCPSTKAGDRLRRYCDLVKGIATELGIAAIEVQDATLMAAYGHPPLTRKEHVRRAGRSIWPSLNDARSKRAAVDAATVGLYVQTERLFSLCEEEA